MTDRALIDQLAAALQHLVEYVRPPAPDMSGRWLPPSGKAVQAEVEAALAAYRALPAERVTCSQCGQPYSARACGPTHAVVASEMAQAPLHCCERESCTPGCVEGKTYPCLDAAHAYVAELRQRAETAERIGDATRKSLDDMRLARDRVRERAETAERILRDEVNREADEWRELYQAEQDAKEAEREKRRQLCRLAQRYVSGKPLSKLIQVASEAGAWVEPE